MPCTGLTRASAGCSAPGASPRPRVRPGRLRTLRCGSGSAATARRRRRSSRSAARSTAAPRDAWSPAPGMSSSPPPRGVSGMTVAPGDYLTAAVIVRGHNVRLQINDVTRRTSFSRSVQANAAGRLFRRVDRRGALGVCQRHLVVPGAGPRQLRLGAVQPRHRDHHRRPPRHDRRPAVDHDQDHAGRQRSPLRRNPSTAFAASPSALSAGGSAFTITYASSSSQAHVDDADRPGPDGERAHPARPRTRAAAPIG